MKIRKQENDLSIDDLLAFPVWEYALDEEGIKGQNEKTLRPYIYPIDPERDKPYVIVRTSFVLANRVTFIGFVKLIYQKDDQFIRPVLPYDYNPVIITPKGLVDFCYGVNKPDAREISLNYERLGYKSKDVFPIRFLARIESNQILIEDRLQGFLYIEPGSTSMFTLSLSNVKWVT